MTRNTNYVICPRVSGRGFWTLPNGVLAELLSVNRATRSSEEAIMLSRRWEFIIIFLADDPVTLFTESSSAKTPSGKVQNPRPDRLLLRYSSEDCRSLYLPKLTASKQFVEIVLIDSIRPRIDYSEEIWQIV